MDPVAAGIKDAAYDCLNSFDPKVEQNFSSAEYCALKELLNDEQIIVQKSDKGNSVVLLNKTDYNTRMKQLLADESKFKKLKVKEGGDYNYLINQEIKISKLFRSLKNKGALNESTYQELNPTGTQPSVLYGLSKVHKPVVDNIPKLRPILSAINTPTYKLSQFLNEILKPFTTNEYTTKDSFAFANDIRSQQASCYMASLDVDSLFTNIPLIETMDICTKLLFQENDTVHGMNREDFKQLLSIATTESFILFDNEFYQQIDGVAMGSPLGPTLANIFLCFHEKKWLSDCPCEFKPVYYQRYVDDIFLLFNNSGSIDQFKQYMNNRHPNMNFTSENESENSLPFLDVYVTRQASQFITSVYRKPTFSGVYTNFDSFLPAIYKSGLITTLLSRSFTICSNWDHIHREIINIKTFLLKNGYPEKLLNHMVSRFLNKIHSRKQPATDHTKTPKPRCFPIILPYLGTSSKRLEKKIKQCVKQYMPDVKISFIYRASTRLRTLFAFKDKIPQYLASGIIYKYTCNKCKSVYIGESIRHTKRRFSEHMGVSALTGKPLRGQNTTAVKDHLNQCRARAVYEDFVILGKDMIENNRRIKESLFIHRDKPELNIQGSSIPLLLF
jgi:hypothetical protein